MSYTANEKQKIILKYKASNASAKNFAPTVGISIQTLRKWEKLYDAGGVEAIQSKNEKMGFESKSKIHELTLENKELRRLLSEEKAKSAIQKRLADELRKK